MTHKFQKDSRKIPEGLTLKVYYWCVIMLIWDLYTANNRQIKERNFTYKRENKYRKREEKGNKKYTKNTHLRVLTGNFGRVIMVVWKIVYSVTEASRYYDRLLFYYRKEDEKLHILYCFLRNLSFWRSSSFFYSQKSKEVVHM